MEFKDFFGHEIGAIDEAAKLLEDLKVSFEHGEITKREFQELSEDVLQIEEVDDIANRLELKAEFDKVLNILRAIVLKIATS